MNEAVYAVHLHGEHIGSLQHRGDFTKFVLDRDYWDRQDRHVLGLWFDNHPRRQSRAVKRVPPWFSNLLPEGRLRDLIANEQGVSTFKEMAILARIGQDLPGAVTVTPEPGTPVSTTFDDALPATSTEGPRNVGTRRASLAGMTMKFSLRQDGSRLVLPARAGEGDFILKTPDHHYPGLPANEHAVMTLAQATGVTVPENMLWDRDQVDDLGPGAWPSDEIQAYVVRRFDRSAHGRVHIEDLAQVLGIFGAGEGKYRYNVETVASLAFRRFDHTSLQEMVRRTVVNLLVGNGDAHLKNWSLIYPDGRHAQLSPAYDLVCTAVYPHHEDLALPFFEAVHLHDVTRDHFARLQDLLHVPSEDVLTVVDETCERFDHVWRTRAEGSVPADVADWISTHYDGTLQRLTHAGPR